MSGNWSGHPTLEGARIRLEPLRISHTPGLLDAADEPEAIFSWSAAVVRNFADAESFVHNALADPDRQPYAVIDKGTGHIVGTTSYYLLEPAHRKLTIGHTWLSTAVQRTHVNTEAKLLLLRHAFHDLGAVRVEWHTDEHNVRSRAALLRIGARFEGLLRKHRRRRDGTWRTTALFSMTDDEWPVARAQLEKRVTRCIPPSHD